MATSESRDEQLWLELPPISATAPKRLIVFLHAAGSTPELLAPVAIAFQLKFPGATVVLMQGLRDHVLPKLSVKIGACGCCWRSGSRPARPTSYAVSAPCPGRRQRGSRRP